MPPIPIRAIIVAAYEPESGPVPGELHHFIHRENLTQQLPFPLGYRPLYLSDDGVLAIATGVGAARAAASVMALGLDPRFDLTQSYWLITGVCGIDPARGSLASVVLPEYVVDGDLTHELDAREIPPTWPDGFIPIGKTTPYEQPRADRFQGGDGIVFRLNPALVREAYNATRSTELLDTPNMAVRRDQFTPTQQPPSIVLGDELSSTTFWHGKLMCERARRWVLYETEGHATYAITAMEDTGILQSLTLLARTGSIDWNKVLIARAASNYDQQREGISPAESLTETKVTTYSAYLPALENAWRVGSHILHVLLAQ